MGSVRCEKVMRAVALTVAAMLTGSAADTVAAPPPKPAAHCFSTTQFDGWRAADATTLFIRADVDRYYRIDLAQECTALTAPDAQLILNVHGSSMICSAAGISVKVTQPFAGIPEPCFVKAMTELSPAEVAVIPKKLRP